MLNIMGFNIIVCYYVMERVCDLCMWYIDIILCVYVSFKNNKTQMILDIIM